MVGKSGPVEQRFVDFLFSFFFFKKKKRKKLKENSSLFVARSSSFRSTDDDSNQVSNIRPLEIPKAYRCAYLEIDLCGKIQHLRPRCLKPSELRVF